LSDRPVLRDSRGRFVKGPAPEIGRTPTKRVELINSKKQEHGRV